jgi:hypothetical protein
MKYVQIHVRTFTYKFLSPYYGILQGMESQSDIP